MRRSAFTFVELAIVLVVFGIIVGLAVKGRSLVESANLRTEVNKVKKIQASLMGWLNANDSGKAEMVDRFPHLDNTTLNILELQDLTAADRENPFGNWVLRQGKMSESGMPTIAASGTDFLLGADNVSPRFACNIELILDNKNMTTGLARSSVTTAGLVDNTSKVILKTPTMSVMCEPWSENVEAGKGLYYRLF